MAFTGRWDTETQEGYDEFCKAIGIPDEVIEKGRDCKVITEITQDGDDFSWTLIYPSGARVINTFTIGKECDMQIMGGRTFKATVNMEEDKLVVNFPKCKKVCEISGGKLIETSTYGSAVLKRTSKKI